jgi:hypothetical protein
LRTDPNPAGPLTPQDREGSDADRIFAENTGRAGNDVPDLGHSRPQHVLEKVGEV